MWVSLSGQRVGCEGKAEPLGLDLKSVKRIANEE